MFGIGPLVLLSYAGLNSIQAAEIDGASRWATRYIELRNEKVLTLAILLRFG